MLYEKNSAPRLNEKLFLNPTSEYRAAPFWAWNSKLEKQELLWQLDVLKRMGFGGAHMHVRTGMSTPYLSDEHMDYVKACIEKAKTEGMLAWLYDEDRWPSGAAGGLVTKDEKYRARHLLFTARPYGSVDTLEWFTEASAEAVRTENGTLLACYDVQLNPDGYLVGWRRIAQNEDARYEKWFAYLESPKESPWFNNQTYINTLDKAAMDRFIDITYEQYNRTVSDEFGKTVPAIFTDEPQFARKTTLKYASAKDDVFLPWADDLPDTYSAAFPGEDILEGLPELIWDRADQTPSVVRYHYHDHVCERFTQAFADNCGKWCRDHGIALTGHLMEEATLCSQTAALGEAMRSYRGFDIPGIDMLCAWFEYTTAKQAQSAVHQYGREGMISELYGVTNWDFDFRGHKLHGDWQAALGVTVRVPHLSWVSMAGEAKRDYPASINYQSPWWNQYELVENHFARVNTAMTRGKPIVKVGVIHPVESYWLHWGPAEQSALVREQMDRDFQDLTQWLLFGGMDFDFISESLLPELCENGSAPMKVGKMAYDAILVPGCETLRSTTLARLEQFAATGGKLIFAGQIPTLEDAVRSERGAKLAALSACIPMNRCAVLEALQSVRLVEFRNQTGALTDNLLYQLRQDREGCWLFIAHGKEPYNKDVSRYQDVRVSVKGNWKATKYNTQNGEVEEILHRRKETHTEICSRMYDYDSLLLWLEPVPPELYCTSEDPAEEMTDTQIEEGSIIPIPRTVEYSLSEPNCLLLDQAEYALDDGEWQAEEEILRLDDICREKLGWPSRKKNVAQPWVLEEEPFLHTVHLRWRIHSEIRYTSALLAIEDIERIQLKWNGREITNTITGWYVDKAIKTVKLPPIEIGDNVLEASIPFRKRADLEWAYILGEFGVEVRGRATSIVEAKKKIAFGTITSQGLPFYGGNITYHLPIETKGGNLRVRSSQYRGVLQKIQLDDERDIALIYPPYTAKIENVKPGKHMVHITLYGHRRNSFGPVHLTDLNERWIGPIAWRSEGELWCYDYRICDIGILTTPEITEK